MTDDVVVFPPSSGCLKILQTRSRLETTNALTEFQITIEFHRVLFASIEVRSFDSNWNFSGNIVTGMRSLLCERYFTSGIPSESFHDHCDFPMANRVIESSAEFRVLPGRSALFGVRFEYVCHLRRIDAFNVTVIANDWRTSRRKLFIIE